MRWPLFLLFIPALAFAATPATFETRSQDHAMVVDVIPVGNNGDATYSVRITDLHTGELLASPKIVAQGPVATSVVDVRDMKIRIMVRPASGSLSASVEIQKGDTIIDSMDARWATKPGRLMPRMTMTPSPAGGAPLRVGGDVKAPVVVSKVEPIYSVEARKARISGIVIVEAIIDKNGSVRDVNVLKPLPFGLDQAAVDAVRQWRFKPAMLNGQPVDVLFNLTVNFRLDSPKAPAPPAR